MEPRAIRHTELPGTSRLFSDYLYEFAKVRDLYSSSPWDPASYRAAAAEIDYPDERREALVAALREQNGGHGSLDLLARRGTLVVATGQQAGLLSGPAYTVYKALTAARLARRLTEQGLPSVPVFWLATEDHDYEEVNHCWVFDAAHRPVRIEAGGTRRSQTPVGPIPIGEGAAGGLRQALAGLPFGDEAAALGEAAYAAGSTFGKAFRALLGELLAPYGLLYLDPLQPQVRELAAPLLGEALQHSSELAGAVVDRNRDLEAAGYHAQVHVEPHSSLLFLLDGGLRTPLRTRQDGFLCGDRVVSPAELLGRAGDLSANAVLRPVIQDYILPTVASVMGPAEVAYMAQAQVLYRELRGRMPVVFPRAGFTILDSRSAKLMDRYGLSLADFSRGEDALRERMAASLVPPALKHAMARTRDEVDASTLRLRANLTGFDPTLAEAMDRGRRKILFQLGKIEGKAARETLRRNERAEADAARLGGLIYPQRHLQERFYSILPLVAKHGLDLIATIYQQVNLDSPDHRILAV